MGHLGAHHRPQQPCSSARRVGHGLGCVITHDQR
jgi:hypothetical protein